MSGTRRPPAPGTSGRSSTGRGGGRRGSGSSNSNRSRGGGGKQLARPKKNTENFSPCHEPPPMRVVVATPGLRLVTRRFK